MKLNKEQLKQIINEELEAITNEVITSDDPRSRSNQDFKDNPRSLKKTKYDWVINDDSYGRAVMEKINDLAGKQQTKLGAKEPTDKNGPAYIVWKANNGYGIQGGSTKNPQREDDYLMFHKKAMGQMPQWGDESTVIDAVENAFLRALPPRNRPSRALMQFNKTLKASITRIADALAESDLVNKFEIYSAENLKKRFEANGGNFNKFALQGVSEVTGVYDLDNLAELSKSDMRKLEAALKGRALQKIAAFLSDPDGFGGLLAKKLKKRGFMDKAGSFVKGKGFNEGKTMKLTKEQLEQIIKEELKLVMQEEEGEALPPSNRKKLSLKNYAVEKDEWDRLGLTREQAIESAESAARMLPEPIAGQELVYVVSNSAADSVKGWHYTDPES